MKNVPRFDPRKTGIISLTVLLAIGGFTFGAIGASHIRDIDAQSEANKAQIASLEGDLDQLSKQQSQNKSGKKPNEIIKTANDAAQDVAKLQNKYVGLTDNSDIKEIKDLLREYFAQDDKTDPSSMWERNDGYWQEMPAYNMTPDGIVKVMWFAFDASKEHVLAYAMADWDSNKEIFTSVVRGSTAYGNAHVKATDDKLKDGKAALDKRIEEIREQIKDVPKHDNASKSTDYTDIYAARDALRKSQQQKGSDN